MLSRFSKSKKAFTLVELLIVLAIIGILSIISLMGYSAMKGRANDAKRKTDLRTIGIALQSYAIENGDKYPISRYNGNLEYISSTSQTAGNELVAKSYIDSIPQDPIKKKPYRYVSDTIKYTLESDLTSPYDKVYQQTATGGEAPTTLLATAATFGTSPVPAIQNAGKPNETIVNSFSNPQSNSNIILTTSVGSLSSLDKPPVWGGGSYTGITIAQKLSPTSMKVYWGHASDDYGALTYEVYYGPGRMTAGSTGVFTSYKKSPITTENSIVINDLDSTKDYLIQVMAYDSKGQVSCNTPVSFNFSNQSTTLPFFRPNKGVLDICTKVDCDKYWTDYLGQNPSEQSTYQADNRVNIYVAQVCGTSITYYPNFGNVCGGAQDSVIIEYKKTEQTNWDNQKEYYMWSGCWPSGCGASDTYLPKGKYDFRVRLLSVNGLTDYLRDSAGEIFVRKGYEVTGKLEGTDYTPPMIKAAPNINMRGLDDQGNLCGISKPIAYYPPGTTIEQVKAANLKATQCNNNAKSIYLNWTSYGDDVAIDHYEVEVSGYYNRYSGGKSDGHGGWTPYVYLGGGKVNIKRPNAANPTKIISSGVVLPVAFYESNVTPYTFKLKIYDVNGNSSKLTAGGSVIYSFPHVFVTDPT